MRVEILSSRIWHRHGCRRHVAKYGAELSSGNTLAAARVDRQMGLFRHVRPRVDPVEINDLVSHTVS
jgi:hypothetical protein